MSFVECDDKDTAIATEILLGDSNYDIGKKAGNGARDNNIYRKTADTIEDVTDDV